MIVSIIRRKPVLTYASIIFENMLASVNSVKKNSSHLAVNGEKQLATMEKINTLCMFVCVCLLIMIYYV